MGREGSGTGRPGTAKGVARLVAASVLVSMLAACHRASHGCARVSNAAMDMIWEQDLMPVGSTVVVA